MSAKDIQVAIKARPLAKKEKDAKQSSSWKIINNSIQLVDSQADPFYFDHIFDEDASNQRIFEKVAKPIVDAALKGFNGTIFAYGQTSSGKTYTMLGDEKNQGVMVLAAKEIFKEIENASDREFLLRVGFMEIYNEKIYDLLNKNNQDLKIHETISGDVSVNCTEFIITSEAEMMHYLQKGSKLRKCGETNMNERSSRSHAIFKIIIESRELDKINDDGCVQISNLNLVDLAGSERADLTGASGSRLKEGSHINRSLLYLSCVIKRLSENESDKFINYRDSKLTRILQASLGGNALTAIICTIKLTSVEETNSTLSFAMRAKSIKNKPQVNEVLSDAAMMKRLEKEIARLNSELQVEKSKNSKIKVVELERQIMEEGLKILHSHSIGTEKKKSSRRQTWCPATDQTKICLTESKSSKPIEHFSTPLITIKDDFINCTRGGIPVLDNCDSLLTISENNNFDFVQTPKMFKKSQLNKLTPSPQLRSRYLELMNEFEELKTFTCLEKKLNVEFEEPLKAISTKLENSQQRITDLILTKEKLQVELDEVNLKETFYLKRIGTVENEILELNKFLNTLNLQKTKDDENYQNLCHEKSGTEIELQQFKIKHKNRENELLEAIQEKDTLIDSLKNQIENYKKKCNDNERFCELKKTTDNLMKENDELSSELIETIQENDTLKKHIDDFKNEINSLNYSIKEFENKVELRNKEISVLKDDFFSEKTTILSNNKSMNEIILLYNERNTIMKNITNDTITKLIEASKTITNLEETRTQLENINALQLNNISRLLDDKQKYIDLFEDMTLKLNNQEAKIENKQATAEINDHFNTINNYNSNNSLSESKVSTLNLSIKQEHFTDKEDTKINNNKENFEETEQLNKLKNEIEENQIVDVKNKFNKCQSMLIENSELIKNGIKQKEITKQKFISKYEEIEIELQQTNIKLNDCIAQNNYLNQTIISLKNEKNNYNEKMLLLERECNSLSLQLNTNLSELNDMKNKNLYLSEINEKNFTVIKHTEHECLSLKESTNNLAIKLEEESRQLLIEKRNSQNILDKQKCDAIQIEDLKNSINEIVTNKTNTENHLEILKKENNELRDNIECIKNEYELKKSKIETKSTKNLASELEEKNRQLLIEKSNSEKIKEKLQCDQKEIQDLKNSINEFIKNKIDAENHLEILKTENNELQNNIQYIKNEHELEKSKIENESKANLESKLEEQNRQLLIEKNNSQEIKEKLQCDQKKIQDLKNSINELIKNKTDAENHLEIVKKENNELRNNIQYIKNEQELEKSKIAILGNNLKDIATKNMEIKEILDSYKIKFLTEKVEINQKEIVRLENIKTKIVNDKIKLECANCTIQKQQNEMLSMENYTLKKKNDIQSKEHGNPLKSIQSDRKNKRRSTHDELRQSLWDSQKTVSTMTDPTNQECSCLELDGKVTQLKKNLFIKESQLKILQLELKHNPFKDELQSIKNIVDEEEMKKKKLKLEILSLKNKLEEQTLKMENLKSNEAVNACNANDKQMADDAKNLLEKKIVSLKALCRLRNEEIKKLKENKNYEKINNVNDQQLITELENLKYEHCVLKQKYDEVKLICVSRIEKIKILENKIKNSI